MRSKSGRREGTLGPLSPISPPLPSNILQILLTTVPVKGRVLNLPARPTWGSADLGWGGWGSAMS